MGGHTLSALLCTVACAVLQWGLAEAAWPYADPKYPNVPSYGPLPAPAYMVDNTDNYYNVAPDKGNQTGPVWKYSGSLRNYITNLNQNTVLRGGYGPNNGTRRTSTLNTTTFKADAASSYWLSTLGPLGSQPLAGDGYQFFRDVVMDFHADNTGASDASEAINAAVSAWSSTSAGSDQTRCGEQCGNSFTQGAIVYFPSGTYKICTPVIQYYYTQFIGDVNNPPTIIGCDTFTGIALFDTDPYIPGGSGSEWYVNQNQFFRQIRNFIFDLTDMPQSTAENDQPLVPTGIHWQVAQATSLQNLVFNMPTSSGSDADNATTAVGIFMENGSGGFVSDLTFNGGNIGWRAGSQQYTARNLKFNDCLTAVQMVWDWGFNWQGIEIDGGAVAFNITGFGGPQGQGTGSISLIDSSISNVPVGILTNNQAASPNIVLDNTVFTNVDRTIQVDGGDTLLSGSPDLWALGKRYNGSTASNTAGDVTAPAKGKGLTDSSGKLYVRSRPQYETKDVGSFLVATTDGACQNDGTGDQTTCVNSFLQNAISAGKIAYFPAGIYRVTGTVHIPTGSVVQGSCWSQILGAGDFFGDMANPQVMVQVGNKGEIGTMEIVEMLFSVQGNTAGAILMEWNTAAASQGAAAMWDSHFRVGGGKGTDLDIATCPKFSMNNDCIASSLMFHVTPQASGYFENVWAWVADHDNDASIFNQPDSTSTQVAIFGARGMLIESQSPSWFYGTGSEHSVLYNYQLSGAKSVYMGHIQTEAPYFQPDPGAPAPFNTAKSFPNDPDFSSCNMTTDVVSDQCRYSWGLRIIDSTDVTLHGAGLYSFFNDFYQDCIDTHNCQERILEVKGSEGVVIFNLFTVATVEIANGIDDSKILQADSNQRGFTTETSVWLPIPGADNIDIVYVGPEIYSQPVVSCPSTCLLIFPTSHLSAPTTIRPSVYITPFEYGGNTMTTINGAPTVVFITHTTTLTISIAPITTDGIAYSNFNITLQNPTEFTIRPSVPVPPVTINLPNGAGSTTSRIVSLPPWPLINQGPNGTSSSNPGPGTNTTTGGVTTGTDEPEPLTTYTEWPPFASIIPVTTTDEAPRPTDDGPIVPCRAWFFFICISYGDIHVGGWHFILPPGIYPPGPPPINIIQPPPGYTITSLPPWPRITIGNDEQITTEEEPECETQTASVCSTTTTFSATITEGGTVTTSSAESSHCETITGCSVSGMDYSTTTDEVEGTQTAAPVGTWPDEAWTSKGDSAYSASVFAALSAQLSAIGSGGGGAGDSGGRVITFTPGPTAQPTCTSSTACGGNLCTGHWCTPTPTGFPPGFLDPSDPNSSGFAASTSVVGGGGNGGNQPSMIPTVSGSGLCPAGQVCLRSTTYSQCARAIMPTFAGDNATEVTPTAVVEDQYKAMVTAAPVTDIPYGNKLYRLRESDHGRRNYHLAIGPRQEGGCNEFVACAPGACATPNRYPCLDLSITGFENFDSVTWQATVKEDGNNVCDVEFTCDDCQGYPDFHDCGGGNSFKFTDNEIYYDSAEYGNGYNFILPQVGEGTYDCGDNIGLTCTSTVFSATEGPCR